MELRNKKVVVLGYGKSGISATRLLLVKGANVIISEKRKKEELSPSLISTFEIGGGVIFETGGHRKNTIISADLVVVSPGVPREVYEVCYKKGIPVWSELELAWRFLSQKEKENTIAITGTNGKTTTTSIVSELLKLSGYKVFTGANFGIPLSDYVLSQAKVDKLVLEVSSFQLETVETFSPKVGILLNITPDHLERYQNEEEYAYYKYRLFEKQKKEDYSILPYKEQWFEKFRELVKGILLFFGKEPGISAYLKNEEEFVLKIGEEEEIYSFLGFKLKGIHNKLNYLAGSLGARLLGASKESVAKLVKEFVGFPHRLEFIGTFGGVYFINDSKATNVDATLQALNSVNYPVILILGGKHKGASYQPLVPLIKEKVKTLIIMGEAKYIIAEELQGLTETYLVDNLAEALALAFKISKPGDTVLFSPACSSFDQFSDYQERGEIFRELVLKYAPSFFKERFSEDTKEVYH